ncbi:glycerol-3-phosphate responsive antiterminator [Halalkalibacter sp. AB-rgal2]|uniref:glycerol-3-phosphate responsive antiterminator n=1 Tax=Halalkalibacter sp. AB-rgal2 TaxID=3242695 RepID=UPI00359D3C2E
MKLRTYLEHNKVIASVRSFEELHKLKETAVTTVFLVRSSLKNIEEFASYCEKESIDLFIYFDMIKGFSQEKEAVAHLLKLCPHIKGIVSNKAHIIREAMGQGIFGIFTIFLLDSYGLKQGIKVIEGVDPDGINVAPGILYRSIENLSKQFNIPVISSGLIETKEDMERLFTAGATALSTSKWELWL